MIWEPFLLALVLGVIVSAGLYFAYLWPSVEPLEDEDADDDAIGASAARTSDVQPAGSDPPSPDVTPKAEAAST